MENRLLISILLCVGYSIGALAQEATGETTPSPASQPFNDWLLQNLLFVLAAATILGALITLFKLMDVLMHAQKMRIYQEKGMAEAYLKSLEPTDNASYFEKLWVRINAFIPKEQEATIDLGHNYDGIRELDNRLPPWWLALFYITIIWAAGYLWYYEWSDGPGSIEEYETEVAEARKAKAQFVTQQAATVDETNVVALTEPGALELGKSTFLSTCSTCHGQNGEGGVGPNMTDDYWIHGCNIQEVFKTIKYGVPDKGMISWAAQLNPAGMQQVASYILTLRGTTPPKPKAAQGTVCNSKAPTLPAASPEAPADSTKTL